MCNCSIEHARTPIIIALNEEFSPVSPLWTEHALGVSAANTQELSEAE